MIKPSNTQISVTRQCAILKISRSGYYYTPKGENYLNIKILHKIDELHMEYPFYGVRQMCRHLNKQRIRRLMRCMGLVAIYQEPKTTIFNKENKRYPYLLRQMDINRPNQVWCADITYIPIKKGFLYLVAILDWNSRKVLSWRTSNTMDVDFCVDALEEALSKYGTPEIFNTDQGSQFTSMAFTGVLQKNSIRISMDGRGRWLDNVFIERLWRSLKYENIYIYGYEDAREVLPIRRTGFGAS